MADPIHHFLTIQNRAGECLETPPDPAQDPCKISVEEASSGTAFLLERKGQKFQVASADASRVNKAFPSYNAPARQIADYLSVQGEFVKALGDEKNPSPLMDKINLGTEKGAQARAIAQWTNILANFIALGQLDPKDPKLKELQTNAIRIAFYTFTDPTLGVTVDNIFKKLEKDPRLTPESQKRIEWLLQISSAREKFWALLKPKMDKSAQLSKELKARSVNLFIFLFANHLLAENGYNPYLFAGEMKDTAKAYHEILSKVETGYDASKNFYAFIAEAMGSMKSFKLKEDYQKDFQLRANFIQTQYEKAAQQEMVDILAAQPAEKSFQEYLQIKYGTTPDRKAALEIILRHMKVKTEKDADYPYSFDMAKIDKDLRAWAGAKSGEEHKAALTAILYLLKALFERGEKMEAFQEGKIQKVDSFYTSGNFALLGTNKKALEDLIVWARSSANTVELTIPTGGKPHIALRKWTLGVEFGVGLAGAATFGSMYAVQDPQARYYGQWTSVTLGASGLCAAGGNLLAHKLDMNGKSWLFDLGGAVLCGSIAATAFGLAAPKPGSGGPGGMIDPGTRYPVDPYGP